MENTTDQRIIELKEILLITIPELIKEKGKPPYILEMR